MSARFYLTLEDALFIHDEQIRLYGGTGGVRDEGLIVSALLRPQTGYYADLIDEAAALWESLTMNHGFLDGNKRVGFACALIFLEANAVRIEAGHQETADFILGHLEAGTFRKDALEAWVRTHAIPGDSA